MEGHERRAFTRLTMNLDVECKILDPDGHPATQSLATLTNICRGGLAFNTSATVPERAIIEFDIVIPAFSFPLAVYGEVVWQIRDSAYRCRAGIQFVQDQNPDVRKVIDYVYQTHLEESGI